MCTRFSERQCMLTAMESEPTLCEKDTEHRMGSARGVREDLLEEVSHELSLCRLSSSSATCTSN